MERTFDPGARGIGVNGIAPGATLTHARKNVLTEDIERQMLAHTPLQAHRRRRSR
jgi:7-alpha-hydroxysteroid dehydrogenase